MALLRISELHFLHVLIQATNSNSNKLYPNSCLKCPQIPNQITYITYGSPKRCDELSLLRSKVGGVFVRMQVHRDFSSHQSPSRRTTCWHCHPDTPQSSATTDMATFTTNSTSKGGRSLQKRMSLGGSGKKARGILNKLLGKGKN
ncbi:hypothetical protein CEXT_507471 [Caerostris extrusa]|uniref:Uncharacterized protein n=1 Tax=Caerostris extrusa TaxID=172846 RepID=A0AAV4NBY0_CAEEX|nr:hypothetical protein CEXT_507471 [Caerostris extrusa]